MKTEAEERIIFSTDADEAHRQLKDELEDITTLNTKIQLENRDKDLQLELSEVQLKKLKDMHISDIQQLEAVSSLLSQPLPPKWCCPYLYFINFV